MLWSFSSPYLHEKHLDLFFDEQWNSKTDRVSYGYDIEASWIIDDPALTAEVGKTCLEVAVAACEGLLPDGSMMYEKDHSTAHLDTDRHWWVQAEAVVGFLNAYELTTDKAWLDKAFKCWLFIPNNLIDTQEGEWFWSISKEGVVNRKDDKAGF